MVKKNKSINFEYKKKTHYSKYEFIDVNMKNKILYIIKFYDWWGKKFK
jgi:hypothetical protein